MNLSQLEVRGIVDPWKVGMAAGWRVIDAATLEQDQVLEADVVIIGTGAGGGVSAEILSKAGLKVVLVEAARLKSSDAFNMDEGEAYRDLYQQGATQATKDGAIGILQGRAVGGTTVVNWTSSFRTPAQTLDYWAQHFGVAGLSRAELDPSFEQMERRLKISKWAMPANANNDTIKQGCEALGWSWGVIPRNVDGCWNLGYCGTGCPTNAKQSMLVTTLPAAMERGATLLHSCQAEVLVHQGGRASGVRCQALNARRQPSGVGVVIKAATVVVAAGGIRSPALLMRSKVADPYRRLGKRTCLHVASSVLGDYDEQVAGYYGAPQSLYSDEFLWRDGVDGAAGYKIESMPTHPGLLSSLIGGFGQLARNEIERLPYYSASVALLRDGFHEHSAGGSVELADNGDAVLDYPLNDYLLDGARRSHLTQLEMHFAAGARSARVNHGDATFVGGWKAAQAAVESYTYQPGFTGLGSAHVMGGCAMGADERHCVVDSDGRFKQLDNVYVFDGSVFPTSLGVNPQLTIYAITARNAERLAGKLSG